MKTPEQKAEEYLKSIYKECFDDPYYAPDVSQSKKDFLAGYKTANDMYENYTTKQGKTKLSDNCMASLMYAIVICKSQLISTHGIGIYQYNRKQNRRHYFDFIISIDKNMISKFEEITNIKLEDPISIILN